MINAGLGESHIDSLLSSMNLPRISEQDQEKREQEFSKLILEQAQECCDEALAEEAVLCLQ